MFRLLNLPREILVHLFLHHFTVQELIQLRALCNELYNLVHYCLSRRRSLKLFFSFAEVQAYSQVLYEYNLESDPALRLHPPGPSSDELILDMYQFNNAVVDLLVDGLFPNVSHLIVFFGDRIYLMKSRDDRERFTFLIRDNVKYLIERMESRLTGLSLFGENRNDEVGHSNSRRLLHKINQIHNLKRLDLCVKNFILCSDNKYNAHMDDFRLPIVLQNPDPPFLTLDSRLLHKLERINVHFYIAQQNGLNFFLEHLFRHLGPNLTQLTMHQLHFYKYKYMPQSHLFNPLVGFASRLAGSITHLKLTQHLSTLLPKVLPRFTGLKSLDLVNFKYHKSEIGMSLPELFGTLAKFCPQLTELKLYKFTLGWIRDDEILANMPQLEQITSLVLRCVDENGFYIRDIKREDRNIPFDKFLRAFSHIFPNLEQFYLKTKPDYFKDVRGATVPFTAEQRLRMVTVCFYYATETRIFCSPEFTCYHLLSEPYRSRHIRECAERWQELKLYKHWTLYYKDFKGDWVEKWYTDENTSGPPQVRQSEFRITNII